MSLITCAFCKGKGVIGQRGVKANLERGEEGLDIDLGILEVKVKKY